MRVLILAVAITMAFVPVPAGARVNEDGGMCWDPDIEFPVPCDEDEE